MKNILYILFLLTLSFSSMLGQKGNGGYRGGKVECLTSAIGFKLMFNPVSGLEDVVIGNGKKVYICPSSLPINVEVIAYPSGDFLEGGMNHQWNDNIDGSFGGNFEGKITSDALSSGADVLFEYEDESLVYTSRFTIYEVTLTNLIHDELQTDLNSAYGFDENKFPSYPESSNGVPYQLALENRSTTISFKNSIKEIDQ